MKLLVLNYEFPPLGGGGGSVTRDLSAELARGGHAVDIVTMSYRGLPAREERSGYRIFRVPSFRRRQATCSIPEMASYVAGAAGFLLRLTARERYDLVHCHFAIPTGPLALMLARVRRLPYVLTCHGSDIPGYNADRFTLAHRVTRPLLRPILEQAAAVCTPSRFLRRLITDQVGAYPVEVVPNGLDVDALQPLPKRRAILLAGRLLPRKGFQHVLQALQGVTGDFEVLVVGDGPMRTELRRLAGLLTLPVTFHGWLDSSSAEFKRLYGEAAIFCMPSSAESFGMVSAEAMCAGCAVIGAEAGATPEVVEHDRTGLLVQPGDVSGLRATLERLMSDEPLRRRLGQAGRDHVLRHFAWPTIARQYLHHFQTATSQ